jgi:hypothetical protein
MYKALWKYEAGMTVRNLTEIIDKQWDLFYNRVYMGIGGGQGTSGPGGGSLGTGGGASPHGPNRNKHTRAGSMFSHSIGYKTGINLTLGALALILAGCSAGAAPTNPVNQSPTETPAAQQTTIYVDGSYQPLAQVNGQTYPAVWQTNTSGLYYRLQIDNKVDTTISTSGKASADQCLLRPKIGEAIVYDAGIGNITPFTVLADQFCINKIQDPIISLNITDADGTKYLISFNGFPAPIQPTPTRDPTVPLRTPYNGSHVSTWGWEGSIQVWGSNFPLIICPGDIHPGFTCMVDDKIDPARTMHLWDSNKPWVYGGEATEGSTTIMFPDGQTYSNITLTTLKGPWYIDAIVGLLSDGRQIPMGYTIDNSGKLVSTSLFMDSGSLKYLETYWDAESKSLPPPSCGIVGTPDNNYSILGDYGVIMFKMLSEPLRNTMDPNNAWQLAGVRIYATQKPQSNFCPK